MDINFLKIVTGKNDLILINFMNSDFSNLEKLAPLTRVLCSRKTGVGANGLICLFKGEEDPFKIRFFRPDGQESVLINDALLCLSRYIFDSAMAGPVITIETIQEKRRIELLDSLNFRISMGSPLSYEFEALNPDPDMDFTKIIRIGDRNFTTVPLFLGKKAAVFLDGGEYRGKRKEIAEGMKSFSRKKDPVYPVFIRINERDEIKVNAPQDKMNVDTASSCALGGMGGVLTGITENEIVIHSRGSRYYFEWDREQRTVFLTGSADYTFSGSYYFEAD